MQQEAVETRQLELPLSREQKLQIAAALKIRDPPAISKTRQRGVSAFAVQIELNSGPDGFCWLPQEVMAAKNECDQKTYRRRRQDAKDLGILRSQEKSFGGTRGDAIDWCAAARIANNRDVQEAPIAHVPDTTDETSLATNPGNFPLNPGNFPPVLPLPKPFVTKDLNTNHCTTYHNHDGQKSNFTQEPGNFPLNSGTFRLTMADLANPDRIDEWFQWAAATGRARECDRHRVFAAARSVTRRHIAAKRRGVVGPGPAAFVSNVRERRWYADDSDDDWARRALQYLDREDAT